MVEQAIETEKPQLKKVLDFKSILIITVNSIMGTGIFFLVAVGAKHAGPASLISWVVLSMICIYISMCFAELTSMFPKSGGVYEFCKKAYGPFWSFIIGWMTLIAGNITIAMLVVGAIQYLTPIQAPLMKLGVALLYIFIFNYIAYRGMKTSATMLVAFGIITVSTLIALIIPGIIHFNPGNFSPFFVFPASALIVTIFLIAETFFGWETATFLAGETKDGARVMPKALIYATIIIAVICILSVITSIGAMPWQEFGESTAPLTDLGKVHFGGSAGVIFTLLVYMSIIGSVAGWIVSAPRLILAMAQDKLFLSKLAAIHPKYNTPHKAILFQTIVTSILVVMGSGSYKTLLELLVPIVLIMYSAVLISLVVLRYKEPALKRYYKAPLGKIGPLLVVVFMGFLLVMWILHTHNAIHVVKLGASFILFGVPIFLLLKLYYDPGAVIAINNMFAYLQLLFEKLFVSKQVKEEMFSLLGNIEGKRILEYGCNVGTLTMDLAMNVGPKGRIYATDMSFRAIKIAFKRIKKRGHKHVFFIHDVHQVNRVHESVPKVDAIVSVGMLGYIQDIKKVLREMNAILPEHGKICLADYVDFFKVLPNVSWLAKEDTIKQIFRECGFSVHVKKIEGRLWNYLYIYGMKSREDVPFI